MCSDVLRCTPMYSDAPMYSDVLRTGAVELGSHTSFLSFLITPPLTPCFLVTLLFTPLYSDPAYLRTITCSSIYPFMNSLLLCSCCALVHSDFKYEVFQATCQVVVLVLTLHLIVFNYRDCVLHLVVDFPHCI